MKCVEANGHRLRTLLFDLPQVALRLPSTLLNKASNLHQTKRNTLPRLIPKTLTNEDAPPTDSVDDIPKEVHVDFNYR
jgi:hypothetical protein